MLLERSRYLLLYLTRVLQSLLTQRTTFGKSPPAPGPRQGSTVRLLIRHIAGPPRFGWAQTRRCR